MANTLFNCTVDLCVELSAEFGGLYLGKDQTDEVRSLISDCILELRTLSALDPQNNKKKYLTKLALTYKEGYRLNSNILPSFDQIIQNLFIRPYTDAMELCNEPASSLDSIKELQIVATKDFCKSSENQITCFQNLETIKILGGTPEIDVRWYVGAQVLAVVQSAVQSAMHTVGPEDATNVLSTIESQIIEAARMALGETKVEIPVLEDFEIEKGRFHSIRQLESKEPLGATKVLSPTPSSMPLFFGFVWPHLREKGWRLVPGNSRSEISFVPPVATKVANRNHNRKDSVARQRSHYARETNNFGLGYIPKLTKRLLIQCFERNDEVLPERKTDPSPSIKAVLESFASSTLSKLEKADDSKNANERQKIEQIITQIISLFDKLVPLTFGKEDVCRLVEGKQWSDVLDCRYLFKFLIVVPSILQQANLAIREYEQSIMVVRELVKFLSEKYRRLFPAFIELPNEEYHSEPNFPSGLLFRMKEGGGMNHGGQDLDTSLKHYPESVSDTTNGSSLEVIRPKDRANLTDFVVTVMSQTVLGVATSEDGHKTGQPYIVCRHCLGVNSGKYFYGSHESLAAATNAIEKHLLKCTKVDDKVRKEVIKTRAYHSKQRKNVALGAQGAFYTRLYARMQSLVHLMPHHEPEIFSDGATVSASTSTFSNKEKPSLGSKVTNTATVTNNKAAAVGENENTDISGREFNNHLGVMDYIQSMEPWRSQKPLAETISKYYNCLDYGGKIFNTDRSPPIFSSEWLYLKLAS